MRQPGIGVMYVVPSGATPTPIPIAILKGVTLGVKITKKVLRGQWKFAIDVAEFGSDIDIKVQQADFRSGIIGMLINQRTSGTGQTLPVTGEAGTIPTTPFQITVAQSGTWVEDGGVFDYTAGKWLTRAASASGTGIYSVAAGVYTFNTADSTHNVSIVYAYTAVTGFTGTTLNATMGPSTPYAVRVYQQYTINGAVKSLGLKFPAVHWHNWTLGLKSEDWAEGSLEGIVAQDPASQTVFTDFVGD